MTKQTRSHSMPNDDKNYYHTNDIDVASTLVCKGYKLESVSLVNRAQAKFTFENHPAIADAVDGFWSNRIEINPLEFSNARKNLKSRIFGMQKSS